MEEKPRHMPLPEWDKKIAPILGAIKSRATWIRVDANQIKDWVKQLVAVPGFETQAMEVLIEARVALSVAHETIQEVIQQFDEKEKIT